MGKIYFCDNCGKVVPFLIDFRIKSGRVISLCEACHELFLRDIN